MYIHACISKVYRNAISGVRQGSVRGPLFFILYTHMWLGLESMLVSSADDINLVDCILSPNMKFNVTESFHRELSKIRHYAIYGARLLIDL